jgi:hypothetical protein
MSLIGVIGSAARRRVSGPWTPESPNSANVHFWLEPDSFGATWADKSVAGNDWTLDGTTPPFVTTGGAEWLSADVVRFVTLDRIFGPSLTSLTAGEIFILLANDYEANIGCWAFGTSADASHFTWGDGNWYESFGRATRVNSGNPSPALTNPIVVNMISASGEWTLNLDNAAHYTTATNTVAFRSDPFIGRHPSYETNMEIRAVIMYDGKLSAGDRTAVYDYLDTLRA